MIKDNNSTPIQDNRNINSASGQKNIALNNSNYNIINVDSVEQNYKTLIARKNKLKKCIKLLLNIYYTFRIDHYRQFFCTILPNDYTIELDYVKKIFITIRDSLYQLYLIEPLPKKKLSIEKCIENTEAILEQIEAILKPNKMTNYFQKIGIHAYEDRMTFFCEITNHRPVFFEDLFNDMECKTILTIHYNEIEEIAKS